jgi:hypothetical protein
MIFKDGDQPTPEVQQPISGQQAARQSPQSVRRLQAGFQCSIVNGTLAISVAT